VGAEHFIFYTSKSSGSDVLYCCTTWRQNLKMEATGPSETLIPYHITTRRHNPGDRELKPDRGKYLRSHRLCLNLGVQWAYFNLTGAHQRQNLQTGERDCGGSRMMGWYAQNSLPQLGFELMIPAVPLFKPICVCNCRNVAVRTNAIRTSACNVRGLHQALSWQLTNE
jgi:hypothetical protein